MEQERAVKIFDSLASNVRLDIFRLLVRYAPDGLVAGLISSKLDIPPNNLSFHLKDLVQSSLATVTQEGRFLRYRANLPVVHEMIAYLTTECCCCDSDSCSSNDDDCGFGCGSKK